MSVLDARGNEVRKVSDDQIIMALNTVAKRNQALQMQLMQLGLLVEFLIEKLGSVALADGTPVFSVDEKEFEDFSNKRYEEIKIQAQEFQELMDKEKENPSVNLRE